VVTSLICLSVNGEGTPAGVLVLTRSTVGLRELVGARLHLVEQSHASPGLEMRSKVEALALRVGFFFFLFENLVPPHPAAAVLRFA
jgi:hypothetical protein